jgi:hypothetical protein
MKPSSDDSPNPPLYERCHHLSPKGRRCSQPACSSHPTLCFTHAPKPPSPEELLAGELSQAAGSLNSPEDVNRLLSKTVLAFIEGRLPLKKAGMIGFLGQIILRTHHEMALQKKVEAAAPKQRIIICDIPSAATERARERMREKEELSRDSPSSGASPAAQVPTPPPTTSAETPLAPKQTNAPLPTPLAAPTPPPKIPDLSHFYPNDPTLHPKFNAYRPITHLPPEPPPSEELWPSAVPRKFAFRHKPGGR